MISVIRSIAIAVVVEGAPRRTRCSCSRRGAPAGSIVPAMEVFVADARLELGPTITSANRRSETRPGRGAVPYRDR